MTILNPDRDLSDTEKQQITIVLSDAVKCVENGTLIHFTVYNENVLDMLFDNEGIVQLTGWRDTEIDSQNTKFSLEMTKRAYLTEDRPLKLKK